MAETINREGNVGQRAQETASAARHTAQEAKSTFQEATAAASQKAQDLGQQAAQKAQEMASNISAAATERAEGASSSLGRGMSSLAGTIRERAPHEGVVGSAATAVADRLQSGGRYLQEHRLGDMTEDLLALIRNHPLPSLFLAFGIGWCVGMLSRR